MRIDPSFVKYAAERSNYCRVSHSCTQCDFKCTQKRILDTHSRTHSDERPFKCILCEYTTKRKSDLSIHRRCMHSEFAPRKKKREEAVAQLFESLTIRYVREYAIVFMYVCVPQRGTGRSVIAGSSESLFYAKDLNLRKCAKAPHFFWLIFYLCPALRSCLHCLHHPNLEATVRIHAPRYDAGEPNISLCMREFQGLLRCQSAIHGLHFWA